ncbi:MAG: hypothetical protein ACE5HO_05845 [bacterium]
MVLKTFSGPVKREALMEEAPYRIEYQPQLVEESVLRAIAGHSDERLFRKERNRLYELEDAEAREAAFHDLHTRWFKRLGLGRTFQQALEYWPILQTSTHKCLLVPARSKKDVCAEMYVAPKNSALAERQRRSVVIQVTTELLCRPQQLLSFLRHELLHIVDMLDPDFGYEPNLPESEIGPTYDRFLQERYRVLWDITIDGRLHQKGWLPDSVREQHWAVFRNTFPGPTEGLEPVFSFFFDGLVPTHQELLSFCRAPESWLEEADTAFNPKGRCSLCRFPSHQLIDAPAILVPGLIDKIQKAHPQWRPTQPICRQCADLYELRLDTYV